VVALGFDGVSDDDFSRTVIAQLFATDSPAERAPVCSPAAAAHEDPSQTSWLPLPFWITASAMRVVEPSLTVARAVGWIWGGVALLLLHVAARALGLSRRAAIVAATIAAVLPWSVRLGASPVPDLVVAAALLASLALAAGSPPDGRGPAPRVLASAALLTLATLSRYEAWFFVPVFAWLATRAVRAGRVSLPVALAGVGLAAVGPVAWLGWNHFHYGSATHFVTVVADYKNELDAGPSSLLSALAYLRAVLRAEPELLVATTLVAAWSPREDLRDLLTRMRPIGLALAIVVVALTLASLRGGGPTHHLERAVYAAPLALTLALATLLMVPTRADRGALGERLAPSRAWTTRRVAALVFGCALATAARFTVLTRESFADREAEIAVGRHLATTLGPDARAIVAAPDFGHFAVQAAAALPRRVSPHRPVGPRLNPAPDAATLAEIARERQATFVVAPRDTCADLAAFAFDLTFCHADLCVARRATAP
jgi:4-amino-4-deoxy-L-arabinose transferase-like glycosyltransferase